MAGPASMPPPEPVTLAGFKGLRNNVTSERLEGADLERARNIDLDDAGQARRRRGHQMVASGQYHSLYTRDDGTVFGVKDGTLGIIRPNYTFEALKPGMGAAPVAYVQVGDDLYFSSSTAAGVIDQGDTVNDWAAEVSPGVWVSPVITPTDTLQPIGGKLLGAPPLATALTYHNGRIYLAASRTLWATELYLYRYVDKTRGFLQFEADITVLGAVADGFYVGTSSTLWFLSGPFNEMRRTRVYSAGCLPGSMVVSGAYPQTEGRVGTRTSLLVMTTEGLCRLQDGGTVYNLTEDRFWFPEAVSAAALYREQDGINQYVGALNSAGTPTSTARVGDYVDAEIRRFQGA